MTCFQTTLTGCQNVDSLNFTYGQLIPSGNVNGVIAFFDGGDGTTPAFEPEQLSMLSYYASRSYGVVEIQWSSAWEQTTNANIQNAACRPATFLNYVYSHIYSAVAAGNPKAGMCAQGFSAGSAAIGYSLAYYGAGSFLDAVELISGPVLSDIKQGCQVPEAGSVTVCPTGNTECKLGADKPWSLPPLYVNSDANYVRRWSNDNSCQSMYPAVTTPDSNAAWLAQSIVDQSNLTGKGATPTFSYPSTAMSGWLCRTLLKTDPICPDPADYFGCPNNSSPQGQIFYSVVIPGTAPFSVYSVDSCSGPEGVTGGTVSGLAPQYQNIAPPGETAVENDMAGAPPPLNISPQCVHP